MGPSVMGPWLGAAWRSIVARWQPAPQIPSNQAGASKAVGSDAPPPTSTGPQRRPRLWAMAPVRSKAVSESRWAASYQVTYDVVSQYHNVENPYADMLILHKSAQLYRPMHTRVFNLMSLALHTWIALVFFFTTASSSSGLLTRVLLTEAAEKVMQK